jgi:UDP-N-acetylglucosamine 1-carboxyvinyltransferase
MGDHVYKVQDGPWPQFPADLTSIAVALATQSEGQVLVHEWMFESRLFFCDSSSPWGRRSTSPTPIARS